MNLCHYLTPNNIVRLEGMFSKEDLLKNLTKLLAEQIDVERVDELTNAIVSREKEGSTFLPTGIAIPHARISGIREITPMLGVIPGGYKEASEDSDLIYLVLLFFSPAKDIEAGQHLKFLARVAAVFNDPAFAKELSEVKDTNKIFLMIQRKERKSAEIAK